jgi:transcriptional regulator with XRE-family HTH domain
MAISNFELLILIVSPPCDMVQNMVFCSSPSIQNLVFGCQHRTLCSFKIFNIMLELMSEDGEMENMTTGQRIKQIRQQKGLTQKQLADRCKPKMFDSAIRRIENSDKEPRLETVLKIADVLGVPVSELLGRDLPRVQIDLSDLRSAMNGINKTVQETATKEIDRRRANFLDTLKDYDVTVDGSSVTFDGDTYQLTSEQINQLPDMTVEQVKALVRSLAKSNMRE